MLALITLDTHINVIFEDTVWATSTEGPNLVYPTIVWMNAGALPCKIYNPDSGDQVDVDTTLTSDSFPEEELIPMSLMGKAGCPLTSLKDIDQNSQDTTHSVLHKKRHEYKCTLCDKVLATASSLNMHAKGKHGHGYVCPCGKRFELPTFM